MISIICSVYNDELYLEESIKSVLSQTYNNFEYIIINDASTDKSQKILTKFSKLDSRIKIIKNKKNLGLTKSLNIGLKHSIYNFIARIDSDDKWMKTKLEKQIKFLKNNPGIGIIGTNILTKNVNSGKISKLLMPKSDILIRKKILHTTPFVHSSIIFKKDLINGYNPKYKCSQDYDLYSRILLKTKGYNLQEFLTYRGLYGKHAVSFRNWKTLRKNRIMMRFSVFQRYPHSIFDYRYFIPDILTLLIPGFVKKYKLKIMRLFK